MTRRFYRKLALLAKIETTAGTDAAPTAVNAIRAFNVNIKPLEGSVERREIQTPFFGNPGGLLLGVYSSVSFDVELAGSGAKGVAPGYGPLLRACGLAETVTAGTKVTYDNASAAQETVSIYANLDGVNHVLLMTRGNWKFGLTPQKIPKLSYTFIGLVGPVADAALPAATYTAFKAPVGVSKANTTFSLHGVSPGMEQFDFDAGVKTEARLLANYEGIEITDRISTASVRLDAGLLADKDWFAAAQARTRGPLSVVHGTADGNIIELTAPATELGQPEYNNSQGIWTLQIPIDLCWTSGDDEFSLIVR